VVGAVECEATVGEQSMAEAFLEVSAGGKADRGAARVRLPGSAGEVSDG
jgi:hypothetical protein